MLSEILWFFILLLLGLSEPIHGWSRGFEKNNSSEGLIETNMRSLLIRLVPQMSPCVVVVYSNSFEPFLQLPEDINVIRVNIDSNELMPALIASYDMKCYGYITDSETADVFLTFLGKARIKSSQRQTPRVLILPSSVNLSIPSCQIFKHPEVTFIPDLVVVSVNDEPREPFVLTIWSNSFLSESEGTCIVFSYWPSEIVDFFPDKVKDLNGKVIRIATLEYPPYTLLSPFEGMEARLLNEFCRKYNCSMSLVTDDDLWGEVYENGSAIGLVGNVYKDKADFGAAAYGAWEEGFKNVEYSFPYQVTSVTILVPKPKKLPEWLIPLLPFSLTLWGLQVFSVLVAAAFMYRVNKASIIFTEGQKNSVLRGEFSSFGGTFLRALAMAVLQPPPDRIPSSSPLRRFFTNFEVLFLFFTTIYAGALSSVLTVPVYYSPIDSPKDLYESGIPWTADHEAWTYSLKSDTDPLIKTLVSRFEVHDSNELITLAKSGGYGLSIEIMGGGHVPETKYLSGEIILGLHVMKNTLYSTSVVILLRKGSPYTEKLNQLIVRCIDTGLFLLWETDVTLTYLSSRLQTAVKISKGSRVEVHEPTRLRIVHIQGAFIMLAIGLAFSLLAFLYEIFKIRPDNNLILKE